MSVISRDAAIDLIDEYMDKCIELHYLPTGEGIKTLIFALPSAQQWIPVSEGLPEYKMQVLTIDKDGDYELNHIVDEEDGEWYWGHPIAWMPLPDPWKGEEDET